MKESEETGGKPTPIDMAGYFDFHPGDLTDDLRREIADTAEAFGIDIEISHHEVALGQNEIDFKYDEALKTADRTITMKMCGKVVGARNGYVTTYMPKPFSGINGSGMHTHQSLWNKDATQNLFYANDERTGSYPTSQGTSSVGNWLMDAKCARSLIHGQTASNGWFQATRRLCILLGLTRTALRSSVYPTSADARTLPDAKSATPTAQETHICSLRCFWLLV